MTLQGSLTTFPLPDVLALLASTGKIGRLDVVGETTGKVRIADGMITSVTVAGASDDVVDGLFQLLRVTDGSFSFEPGEPEEVEGHAVEAVLDSARDRLAEWHELLAVVPSSDKWLELVAVDADEVRIPGDLWAAVVTIGSGTSVAGLGAMLDLGEFDVLRLCRDLVATGVVAVIDSVVAPIDDDSQAEAAEQRPVVAAEPVPAATVTPPEVAAFVPAPPTPVNDPWATIAPPPPPPPPPPAPAPEAVKTEWPEPAPASAWYKPEGENTAERIVPGTLSSAEWTEAETLSPPAWTPPPPPPGFQPPTSAPSWPTAEAPGYPPSNTNDAWSPMVSTTTASKDLPIWDPSASPFASGAPEMAGHLASEPVPGSSWGAESGVIAQQLASLNPQAARAVAAAAMATTAAERESALSEAEQADDTFDRSLLLKFLGSVEG